MFNETDVIAGLRNGDFAAFQEVWEKYHKALIQFGNRLNDDKGEVEDAVTHAFTKLWEKRQDFDNLQNTKAFLYVTVRNKVFDQLRNTKRKREKEFYAPIEDFEEVAYEQESYEQRMEREELLNLLPALIETLDDQKKQILKLSMAGMKSREIGEKFGLTEVNVNTIKGRIRSELKEKIMEAKQGRGPSMSMIIMLFKLIPLN